MDKFDLRIVSDLILSKGLKVTTMDDVANTLKISKRTLYERYPSKKVLIKEVIAYWQDIHRSKIENIIEESHDMMEAFYHAFSYHHSSMLSVNPRFYQDIETYYPEVRCDFDRISAKRTIKFLEYIKRGVDQGVFRKTMNYKVTLKLLDLQYEALKRMELNLKQDVLITETFKGIMICFLRSIATPEGMKILDRLCEI